MLRHLLATSLAVLLASAPLAAQPNDFDLAADCTIGLAGGEWNLPAGDRMGSVRGILVDGAGRRLGFEGVLTPVRTAEGIVRGRLEGALYPLKKDDKFHPKAIAAVRGNWVAGPLGRGRFRAGIAELPPNNGQGHAQNAVAAAGKIGGTFADLLRAAETSTDTVGQFACRWLICR